jgi:hypothetical protein
MRLRRADPAARSYFMIAGKGAVSSSRFGRVRPPPVVS